MITPGSFLENYELELVKRLLFCITDILTGKPKDVRKGKEISIELQNFINEAVKRMKSKRMNPINALSDSVIQKMKILKHPLYAELLRRLDTAGWEIENLIQEGKTKKRKIIITLHPKYSSEE